MTVVTCPGGCGGTINTSVSSFCGGCRFSLAEQRFKSDPDWCWEWFGPPSHRMKCRRKLGHSNNHHDHEDEDSQHLTVSVDGDLVGRKFMVSEFEREIQSSINRCSMENGSDTPDFILAAYLNDCLKAFNRATAWRAKWFSPEGVPENERDCGPTEMPQKPAVARTTVF